MLKGKAIIELTDVNTGEKTVQVEDNLMTKALETFFNQPLAAYSTQSLISNSVDNLFAYNRNNLSWATAGLVVSNQALPESPDTLEVPLSTLLGAAAKQYKTQIDDGIFGTYNEAESFIDVEHGVFNHVFDFPTSACNGTVRCLSIMHPGGVIGLPYAKYDGFKDNLDIIYRRHYFLGAEISGQSSSRYRFIHPCPGFSRPTDGTVTDTLEGTMIGHSGYGASYIESDHYSNLEALMRLERILAFDVTDNSMYTITWTAADKFVIRKRLSRFATLCAMTPFKLLKEYPEITVTTQTENKKSRGVSCVDKVTKKAYYITPSKNENTTVSPGDSMHLFETDLTTGETRHFDIPNATGESLYLTALFQTSTSNYGSSRQSVIIHNGNMYIPPATAVYITDANLVDKYKWFKIPLNNPSNVIVCRPVAGFGAKGSYGNMPRNIQLLDDRYLSIQNTTASLILNIENDTLYNDYGADSSILSTSNANYKIINYGFIPIIGSKYTFATFDDHATTAPSATNWKTECIITFMRLDIPMTINNLSTPIHKTPSQTMKVTYVIREVEGGE